MNLLPFLLVLGASLAPLIGLPLAAIAYVALPVRPDRKEGEQDLSYLGLDKKSRQAGFPWVSRLVLRTMPASVWVPAVAGLGLCAVFLAALDWVVPGYGTGTIAAVGMFGLIYFPYNGTKWQVQLLHLIGTDIFFTGALARIALLIRELGYPAVPSWTFALAVWLVVTFLMSVFLQLHGRSIIAVRTSDKAEDVGLRVFEVAVVFGLLVAGLATAGDIFAQAVHAR